MKRFIWVAALALSMFSLPLPSLAIDKGTFRIGAGSDFAYESMDVEGSETTAMDIRIEVGYFMAENAEVGLGLEYSSEDDDISGSMSVTRYSPYFQYYFPHGMNHFMAGAGLVLSTGDMDSTGLQVTGGYMVMINDSLTLDFGLMFESGTMDTSMGDMDYDSLGLMAGLSLFLK